MSMKNSNDTIGNRTRDLPACSAVPQPTAPPRAPINIIYTKNIVVLWLTLIYIYIYTLVVLFQFYSQMWLDAKFESKFGISTSQLIKIISFPLCWHNPVDIFCVVPLNMSSLVIIRATQCRMRRWIVNEWIRKGLEESDCRLTVAISWCFWRDWEKPRKPQSGHPVTKREVRSRQLSDTSIHFCC